VGRTLTVRERCFMKLTKESFRVATTFFCDGFEIYLVPQEEHSPVIQEILSRRLFTPGGAGRTILPYYRISQLVVGKVEGVIVGWAAEVPYTGDPALMVYVKPVYRRQGLGSCLVDQVEGELLVYTGDENPTQLWRKEFCFSL